MGATIKQYRKDDELYKKLTKVQYKKHPAWKARKGVRIMGVIALIVIICMIYLWFSNLFTSNGMRAEYGMGLYTFWMVIITIGAVLTVPVPFWLYIALLLGKCFDGLVAKQDEELFLTEEKIINSYFLSIEGDVDPRISFELKYTDIDRMVLNKAHDRLEIYSSQIKRTQYRNRSKDNIKKTEIGNSKHPFIFFYMYYTENEDFLQKIEERSGIKIEYVDHVEVLLKRGVRKYQLGK